MVGVIVCSSKCLYCGRATPHECCHDHSEALHPGWWEAYQAGDAEGEDPLDALWGTGYDRPPEVCEDGACPVWGPGEWDHRQKWANMTPEARRAEADRLNREIAERRAARVDR